MRLRVSRRRALTLFAGAAGALTVPRAVAAEASVDRRLVPRVARQQLIDARGGEVPLTTEIWGYDGRTPGPEIRVRQGDRLRVAVTNELPSPTTVHWHGVRLPVEMDGVPYAPTPPILPGASFTYDFTLRDAGTFWYHPHFDDPEQMGRGLAGALIVEEASPPAVDRELVWVLGDWRLDRDVRIVDDFESIADMSHAGRLGNMPTINGRPPGSVALRTHERLRLRLINAANARIFELEFSGHRPAVLALDGQPLAAPVTPDRIVLAPGQRADLLLDCPHEPGARFVVLDHGATLADGKPRPLAALDYRGRFRTSAPREPVTLPHNPLPQPDLGTAVRCHVALEGGALGGLARGRLEGEEVPMDQLLGRHRAWALNGAVASSHYHFDAPLMTLRQGQTGHLTVVNQTAWPHPMHLHGFPVLVLDPPGPGQWRDTVLIAPGGQVEMAFVAERPGPWMLHCHILEHQAGGMMGFVNVVPFN